tara:strand:- start:661 stop:1200 length:540 start_codon:yes stop_codon:yes gene_type:complete
MIKVEREKLKPIFSKPIIKKRVNELANDINIKFANKNPIFIGVLNGSFIFLSDLLRRLEIDCEVDFIKVASYNGILSTGKIKTNDEIIRNLENRHLIIVEDIIDTGRTIQYLLKFFKRMNPSSITIMTLLHKPKSLKIKLNIDYIGFEISPDFVVGYGLDYNQKFRNLDSIYYLRELAK